MKNDSVKVDLLMEKIKKFLTKFSSDFGKLGKKEKSFIIAILIASFTIGLGISTSYQKFITKPAITPTPVPSPILIPASLTLISDKKEVKVGATFSATLSINSSNQGVEAADFFIRFDPDYLKATNLTPGTFFKVYPQKVIEKDYLKISGVASLTDQTILISRGKGTIASITFETLAATESSPIVIDKAKTIVASGGKNILGKTNDLKISIK